MGIKTLANKLNPLTWNVPITNPKDGTPTVEFQRKWGQQQAQNASIPDLTTVAAVSAVLDLIGSTEGQALYRGAVVWTAALPGGDLSGTYPNPTVAKIQGQPVSGTAPTAGQVLEFNGTEYVPTTFTADNNPSSVEDDGTTLYFALTNGSDGQLILDPSGDPVFIPTVLPVAAIPTLAYLNAAAVMARANFRF